MLFPHAKVQLTIIVITGAMVICNFDLKKLVLKVLATHSVQIAKHFQQ